LRRERARRELRKRDTVVQLFPAHPAAPLDELSLHVAYQRDRSAKTRRTEPEEITKQLHGRRPPTVSVRLSHLAVRGRFHFIVD
jgi:hypothetical protein